MIAAVPGLTVGAFYADAYRPLRLVGASPRTIESYTIVLSLWSRFAGETRIDLIDSRLIARWAESLLPARSPATVNSYVRHLMAILRFAEDEDEIGRAPKFRKLRELKRVPLALTEGEFLTVLAVAKQARGYIGGIPAPAWWESLLSVGWETGLRITALLSVAARDVLLDQGGLYCQAETQKDREAEWYSLSPAAVELVRAIFDPRRKLLWPMEITINGLRRQFRKMLDCSGIYAPKGAGMAFHRLRRSTASYVAAAGGNAQRKLGHSAPSVTERYLDPRIVGRGQLNDLAPVPRLPLPPTTDQQQRLF